MSPQPLPKPSITPLAALANRPLANQRIPNFRETLVIIWRWLRGVEPGWRDLVREAKLVEALAEGIEAEEGEMGGKDEQSASQAAAQPAVSKKTMILAAVALIVHLGFFKKRRANDSLQRIRRPLRLILFPSDVVIRADIEMWGPV